MKTMKTMKSLISFLLIVLTILSVYILPVSAEEQIVTPRLNNAILINTDFSISSSGLASIYVYYEGYKGITTGARIEVTLQRKTWGLFWSDVETWTRIPGTVSFTDCLTYQLTKTGTYRAIVEYEIRGTGESDFHTFEHEITY